MFFTILIHHKRSNTTSTEGFGTEIWQLRELTQSLYLRNRMLKKKHFSAAPKIERLGLLAQFPFCFLSSVAKPSEEVALEKNIWSRLLYQFYQSIRVFDSQRCRSSSAFLLPRLRSSRCLFISAIEVLIFVNCLEKVSQFSIIHYMNVLHFVLVHLLLSVIYIQTHHRLP